MRTKKESAPSEALPESFDSLEAFWEFWDSHSSADYENLMEPVEVELIANKCSAALTAKGDRQ
jgi:hypothetical protein